jgi:hypothetical protein
VKKLKNGWISFFLVVLVDMKKVKIMEKEQETTTDRLSLYRAVKAKLAQSDPSSEEFDNLQAEAEELWANLTLEERAVAHENTNV